MCKYCSLDDLKGRFCSDNFSFSNSLVFLIHYKCGTCEIFSENGTLTGQISSLPFGRVSVRACFALMNSPNRQMIQTAVHLFPLVGKMQPDTSEWKGHYVASLSRRGFGGSVHLSAIRDGAQETMERGLVLGSGCAWFGQIVRCWGNTFICLLLMDPRAFL